MDKVTRQCPRTTTFSKEKGEPKRYRTEVLPLTSLTPYRWAKPAHTALRLLPQSYQYPDLSEGADRVGGQLQRGKECPVSDVTSSGRVWRKVPKTDARSVGFCRDRDLGGLCFCLVYLLAGPTVMVGVT